MPPEGLSEAALSGAGPLGGANGQLCTNNCATTNIWGLPPLVLLGLPGSARGAPLHDLQGGELLTCRSPMSEAQLAGRVTAAAALTTCVLVQGNHFQHSWLWCLL